MCTNILKLHNININNRFRLFRSVRTSSSTFVLFQISHSKQSSSSQLFVGQLDGDRQGQAPRLSRGPFQPNLAQLKNISISTGSLWLTLVLSGLLWGSFWLPLALSGSLWLSLAPSGSLGLSLALRIYLQCPYFAHKALARLVASLLRYSNLFSPDNGEIICCATSL